MQKYKYNLKQRIRFPITTMWYLYNIDGRRHDYLLGLCSIHHLHSTVWLLDSNSVLSLSSKQWRKSLETRKCTNIVCWKQMKAFYVHFVHLSFFFFLEPKLNWRTTDDVIPIYLMKIKPINCQYDIHNVRVNQRLSISAVETSTETMHYIQKLLEGGQSDNKMSIYEMEYNLNAFIHRTYTVYRFNANDWHFN